MVSKGQRGSTVYVTRGGPESTAEALVKTLQLEHRNGAPALLHGILL